ncbi:MAG: CHAT domain-containing protein [Goleter apudmare HA4340-LM2]|jgi:filamentous hemagglutinin family protein|nr:CHAT domain-containing protein [Goleter apudmare HA4340-LM2]
MNLQIKSVELRHQTKFHFQQFLLRSKINSQLLLFLLKNIKHWWLALLPLASVLGIQAVQAQSIVPAADGTGTVVAPNGSLININGGQLSGDNANLFHSFTRFGLNSDQIANFLSTPGIQNILGRVVGKEASVINGQIQVTGSNANLFLMNPSGFVFGSNASLNVPGAFTATTANGIGFGSNWFSASGTNNYAVLTGNPGAFSFAMTQPGGILNFANLAVGNGQSLTLLGGTVANTGTLSAPGGEIVVSAVPGEKLVRLSQPGSPLSLEIQPLTASNTQAQNWSLPISSLPQLLTSGGGGNANTLNINSDGKVAISGSGITVENGDVVTGNITAKTAMFAANRNVTGVESRLQTTGDLSLLAGNQVQMRDSVANPFVAKAGGNLLIQGNQGIDILALNHPGAAFQSGGNLSLISDGIISGDAHFTSGGSFSILNLTGKPGTFVSYFDPIIRSSGDVTFGDYIGAALKVEAVGSINAGNITITEPDFTGTIDDDDPDFDILTRTPALILRAGLPSVTDGIISPVIEGGTSFTPSQPPSSPGNITVGNINTSSSGYGGGPVILSAPGNISTGDINASQFNPGNLNIDAIAITSTNGNINTGNLDTSGYGGPVTLSALGDVTTGDINTSGFGFFGGEFEENSINNPVNITATNGDIIVGNIDTSGDGNNGGAVTLEAGRNITFGTVNTLGRSFEGETAVGGDVTITANGVVRGTGIIPISIEDSFTPGNTTILARGTTPGTVRIQHDGGADNVPFIVGNSADNGTAGAIDAGATSRITADSFPVLPNDGEVTPTANITIASVNTPPTLTINPQLSVVQQDQPIPFTYADLIPTITDANQDNTTLEVVEITTGTLRKNGVVVVPGTASAFLVPGDTLEYTPPTGFSGEISPVSLRAGDRVSFSAPQTITFNVAATPPPPPEDPLPPPEKTDPIQKTPPGFIPPPTYNPPRLPILDPAVETIDNKFASQFQLYLRSGTDTLQERRRVNSYEAQDILRQIEKATGVKPAIIYISFIPSGADGKILQSQQATDNLDLLIVTAKGQPIRKTIATAKRQDVLEIAEELYGTVETPNNDNYLAPAQELYQLIVAPLKEELDKQGINNLLFIADEGLRSLPFAALHDGKQFLVENYSVGFTPALGITDTRYVDIRNSQVLAMGASKFEKLDPLPAVPEELSIVAQEIWQGKFFVNQNFTLNNLKSLRQNQPYGILHLATHGNFEKGEPTNSFIQFWDSQLNVAQMRNLDLNNPTVELLVLSACRTALGDRNAELGFGGIAYNVGVKTAVASLWQVSDAGTLGFMTEFYKNLKTAPIKSEALRQAQLAMLKGQVVLDNGILKTSLRSVNLPPASPDAKLRQDLKHPFYWSAFTMIGNPW